MDNFEAEKELVIRAKRGDRAALTRLLQQITPKIASIARAFIPNQAMQDDVIQDVLVKLIQNIRTIRDSGRFGAYVNQVTRHHIFSLLRRKKYRQEVPHELLVQPFDTDDSSERGEEKRKVHEALVALQPEDRRIILMRHWLDASYEEIASMTHLSVSAVQSRLFRIRKHLRKLLSPLQPDDG